MKFDCLLFCAVNCLQPGVQRSAAGTMEAQKYTTRGGAVHCPPMSFSKQNNAPLNNLVKITTHPDSFSRWFWAPASWQYYLRQHIWKPSIGRLSNTTYEYFSYPLTWCTCLSCFCFIWLATNTGVNSKYTLRSEAARSCNSKFSFSFCLPRQRFSV